MTERDDARGRVTRLQRMLGEEVARAFDAAYDIEEPAGSSEAWHATCARWGVAPIGEVERAEVRSALRPLRGAAIPEVQAVAEELAREVRVEARRVSTFDVPRDVEAAHEKLLRACDRMPADVVAAYRAAVLPKRQGMFGNVMKHHDPAQKSRYESPTAHAMRCTTCGAPRLSAQGFECEFCGGHMAERGGGS